MINNNNNNNNIILFMCYKLYRRETILPSASALQSKKTSVWVSVISIASFCVAVGIFGVSVGRVEVLLIAVSSCLLGFLCHSFLSLLLRSVM